MTEAIIMKMGAFEEMTSEEMQATDGGLFSFIGDIYEAWCNMWKDFGKSIYYCTH